MTHTKGPWTILKSGIKYPSFQIIAGDNVDDGGSQVCSIFSATMDLKEQAEANARLIAAAPELLEACQKALTVFKELAEAGRYPESLMADNGGEGLSFLTNAIQKATTNQ